MASKAEAAIFIGVRQISLTLKNEVDFVECRLLENGAVAACHHERTLYDYLLPAKLDRSISCAMASLLAGNAKICDFFQDERIARNI